RFAALVTVKNAVEDHARYEYRREQVRQQTEGQGDCETLHRSCTEQEQNGRRNNRGYVRIDDRQPGVRKSLLHRRWWRLAIAQLFADTLEDQYVRIDTHTDRQDQSRNARQRQRRR